MANGGISGTLASQFPLWRNIAPLPVTPADPGRPTPWRLSDLLRGRERIGAEGPQQGSERESPPPHSPADTELGGSPLNWGEEESGEEYVSYLIVFWFYFLFFFF